MSFDFFQTVFVFWAILNPVGNIPVIVTLLKGFESKKQLLIMWREMVIALIVMILFLFFGTGFFGLMQISLPTLQIAGGVIIFMISIQRVFFKPEGEGEKKIKGKEPFIVPIAVPLLAGPGILATITLYAGSVENKFMLLLAVITAWLFALPVALASSFFNSILKKNGLVAVARVLGYLVVLIAVQMVLKGVTATYQLQLP